MKLIKIATNYSFFALLYRLSCFFSAKASKLASRSTFLNLLVLPPNLLQGASLGLSTPQIVWEWSLVGVGSPLQNFSSTGLHKAISSGSLAVPRP